MAISSLPAQRPFGATSRPDAWWVQPLLVFLGFSAFIIYSTWAAFHPLYNGNCAYWFGGNGANYLSPFFSPEIFGYSPHRVAGRQAGLVAGLVVILPGIFGFVGARRISFYLLLLSRGILQGILG